jgi:ammonium transporter Rh
LLIAQLCLVGLFWAFTTFSPETDPEHAATRGGRGDAAIVRSYGLFTDIHVMVFVGIGLLMSYLKRYGYGATALNLLVGAAVVQLTVLADGFFQQAFVPCGDVDGASACAATVGCAWRRPTAANAAASLAAPACERRFERIPLTVERLVGADYGAATALISFCVLVGKASPAQAVWLAAAETLVYSVNSQVVYTSIGASDLGATTTVHVFAAAFGAAASLLVAPLRDVRDRAGRQIADCASSKASDVLAMAGTLFLWAFWPSFIGAFAADQARARVVVNTVLSLCASCGSSFFMSRLLRPRAVVAFADLQNASLAGGVAIGAVADMALGAGPALLVGTLGGASSVASYVYVGPWLERVAGLHDTCGVVSLHLVPGLVGGLASVACALATDADGAGGYGDRESLLLVWPGWAADESRWGQAWDQLLALLTSAAMGAAGGCAAGYAAAAWLPSHRAPLFRDAAYFAVPGEDLEEGAGRGELPRAHAGGGDARKGGGAAQTGDAPTAA